MPHSGFELVYDGVSQYISAAPHSGFIFCLGMDKTVVSRCRIAVLNWFKMGLASSNSTARHFTGTAGFMFLFGHGKISSISTARHFTGTAGFMFLFGHGKISSISTARHFTGTAGFMFLFGHGKISSISTARHFMPALFFPGIVSHRPRRSSTVSGRKNLFFRQSWKIRA